MKVGHESHMESVSFVYQTMERIAKNRDARVRYCGTENHGGTSTARYELVSNQTAKTAGCIRLFFNKKSGFYWINSSGISEEELEKAVRG